MRLTSVTVEVAADGQVAPTGRYCRVWGSAVPNGTTPSSSSMRSSELHPQCVRVPLLVNCGNGYYLARTVHMFHTSAMCMRFLRCSFHVSGKVPLDIICIHINGKKSVLQAGLSPAPG